MKNTFKEIIKLLQPGILLVLIGIFLSSAPLEAYFKNASDEVSDRKLSESITQTGKNEVFIPTVYKNNQRSTANIEKNPIINNRSDLLTELMEIDIRRIQEPIQSNTMESGRFIENLIYANLRIRRLIDQYNRLHEDADYFQKTYLHPTADVVSKGSDKKPKDDSSSTTGDFDRITSEYDILKRQFSSTSKIADTKESSRSGNLYTVGNIQVGDRGNKSSFQTFTPKQFNVGYKPRVAQKSDGASPPDETDSVEKAEDRERRPQVRTSEMPWMIRFVVSTVDYFIQNKIEGLIYLGMIVFVVSVLAGERR